MTPSLGRSAHDQEDRVAREAELVSCCVPRTFLLVAAVSGLSVAASERPDFCSSKKFHEAFFDGQDAIDFPEVSPKLVVIGDVAVPCLDVIARGHAPILDSGLCAHYRIGCREWAVSGLTKIGTAAARGRLLALLNTKLHPSVLVAAMSGVTHLRIRGALPTIRGMLEHANPGVRAQAVLGLGNFGERSDFDGMAAAARGLPAEHVNTAVRGLELLGDRRALEVLEDLGRKFDDVGNRNEIQAAIERIRSGKPIRVEDRPASGNP